MKKAIFLCLLIPILASGQDSVKTRHILEKSIQAMSLEKYKTLEYTINREDYSYSENKSSIFCKVTLDPSDQSIKKIWAETKRKNNKKTSSSINYFDKSLDTAMFCNKDGVPYRVGNYKSLQKASMVYDLCYEYFISAQSKMKGILFPSSHPHPDKKDTIISTFNSLATFPEDSVLQCKGIVKVNSAPCYLIEQISVERARLRFVVERYPDYKKDAYESALHYTYFYIDTTNFILRRIVNFTTAKNHRDTTFYKITTLISYKPDAFADISFIPKNAQQVSWDYYDNELNRYSNKTVYLNKKAPDIKGKNSEGNVFSLYNQKSKYYVLAFLSNDKKEYTDSSMAFIDRTMKKYNVYNIQYIFIDSKDKMDVVKNLSQEKNISIVNDSKASKKYGIDNSAAYYILDENFNILYATFYGIWDDNKKDIERILSKL